MKNDKKQERKEIELKSGDKKVNRMTRDGLVEDNLAQKTTERISNRTQDVDMFKPETKKKNNAVPETKIKPKLEFTEGEQKLSGSVGQPKQPSGKTQPVNHFPETAASGQQIPQIKTGTPQPEQQSRTLKSDIQRREKPKRNLQTDLQQKQKRQRQRENQKPRSLQSDLQSQQEASKLSDTKSHSPYALEKAEFKLEKVENKLEKVKKQMPQKKVKKPKLELGEITTKKEQKLLFEGEIKKPKRNPLIHNPVTGIAKKAAGAAMLSAHGKIYQVQGENVGVESAHKTEMAVEYQVRRVFHKHGMKKRHNFQIQKKASKLQKKVIKKKSEVAYQKVMHKKPELAKANPIKKALQKTVIKKRYAKQFRKQAKQAAKKAKQGTSTVTKMIKFAVRYKFVILILGLIVILFSMCSSMTATMGTAGMQSLGSYVSGAYQATDDDINKAEMYYTEKETDLMIEAYAKKNQNPGYDEYRMNIGELEHNPYELMAYLSAKYTDFKFDSIKPELDSLFSAQYRLTTEEVTETRTREIKTTDPETVEETVTTEEYEYRIFIVKVTSTPFSAIAT